MRTIPLLVAAGFSCIGSVRLNAQGTRATPPASTTTTRRDSTAAIDRWVSRPTPITLTSTQRAQYDTLRAGFIRAMDRIRTDGKSAGEMATMMKVRDVTLQYQASVRAILTPAQQPIFDANVKADVIGG